MIVTQKLDIHLDQPCKTTIETVQSDVGRAIEAFLYCNNRAWLAPEGATASVRYSIFHEGEVYTSVYDTLPDGQPAVDLSSNLMVFCLTPEVLSIVGVGELQVSILHEGILIATLNVLLRVHRNLGLEGLKPSVYADMSQQIQNQVVHYSRLVYDQGSLLDKLHHRITPEFSIGGVEDSSFKNLICSDLIYHAGREVTVIFPAGLEVRCYTYDQDCVCQSVSPIFTESFTFHSRYPFLRIEAGYVDGGIVQDLPATADQLGIFYASDHHDSFRGRIVAHGVEDLAQCADVGYYSFTAEDLQVLSDAPPICTGGIMEVHPHSDLDHVFQTIRTTDGQLWFRKDMDPFCRVGGGLTAEQIAALDGMFRAAAYTADASAPYAAFRSAFGLETTEPEIPDVPDHTHSYASSVTTEATCETAGVRTYACTCGHSYTQAIPATGHSYVNGVCTRCGKSDPNYDAGGDEPDATEPVYRLAEATTFNADKVVDTGYKLLDVEKSWSVCVDCTDAARGGVVWDASPNGSQGLALSHNGSYYRRFWLAGSLYKDLGSAVGPYKVIITHEKNTDKVDIHYLAPEAAMEHTDITYTKYLTDRNIIAAASQTRTVKIGGNFDGSAASYKGTVNRFEIYERVLTANEISAFMEVTE